MSTIKELKSLENEYNKMIESNPYEYISIDYMGDIDLMIIEV